MAGLAPAIDAFEEASPVLRKIVSAVIIIPLVVILVAFAVANRQSVTISFDPLSSAHPAYAITWPLFLIVFAVLILGVVIGGFATWLGQGVWRRTARRLDADVRALHEELAAIRRRFGTDAPPPAASEPNPPLVIPPPEP
jgi:uncharacterized integral membrane protein